MSIRANLTSKSKCHYHLAIINKLMCHNIFIENVTLRKKIYGQPTSYLCDDKFSIWFLMMTIKTYVNNLCFCNLSFLYLKKFCEKLFKCIFKHCLFLYRSSMVMGALILSYRLLNFSKNFDNKEQMDRRTDLTEDFVLANYMDTVCPEKYFGLV